jgi:general secretion pathway protein K
MLARGSLCPSGQVGVALITVLLVVFLATVAATALATVQQLAVRRGALLLHQQQARHYLLGGEQWAAVTLRRDLSRSDTDHLAEDWAIAPAVLPVEGGSVSGDLEDIQGRFNLNNLLAKSPDSTSAEESDTSEPRQEDDSIDPLQLATLRRLLELLELDAGIAQAIADWIDQDSVARFPDGAEDGEYSGRNPPYLPANRPLRSISELRSVSGINRDAYARLAPFVSALPIDSESRVPVPVNLNTTSAEILAAVADLELGRAETIIETRPDAGYARVEDFITAAALEEDAVDTASLAVASRHFLVRMEARVGSARARLSSVLRRPKKIDGGIPDDEFQILLRSFGQDD